MGGSPIDQKTGLPDVEFARARRIGVGCFTTFVGLASGGMIGVLIGMVTGKLRRCVPIEGTPACDWYYFAAAGMILGAVTLPILALRRLRRTEAAQPKS